MKRLHHDLRISRAEATVLLELARRLETDPELAAQLSPAEHAVVANLADVLAHATFVAA